MNEFVLIGAATLLLISVLASKVSDRFGVPALLLFLLLGMLVGSDGPGGIYFDDPALAQSLGVLALILILFSGGLDTDWNRVRPVLKEGLLLATVGVFTTPGRWPLCHARPRFFPGRRVAAWRYCVIYGCSGRFLHFTFQRRQPQRAAQAAVGIGIG